MGNWILRALRDWRVWALAITVQGPAVRAVARYAPWPALLFPAIVAVAILFYGACLHGPLVPWVRRSGSRLGLMAGAMCLIAAVNVIAYPRADARKVQGAGSDEDDALITTGQRLIAGQRPLYVTTYLGNAPSVGPGWAALVAPLAVSGTYALLTPLALCLLVWIVRRAGGGDAGTALALLLPTTAPAFWELSVTGSDLFAIGVLFVALTACAWRLRRLSYGASALMVVLVVAAATARAALAYVTACVSVFMWQKQRPGAVLAAAATAAIVAAEAWFWWPDREGVTPLYLHAKLAGLLGTGGVGFAAIVAVSSAAWAIARLDESIETWWRGVWVVLVVPLAATSLGVLAALGWHVADWQAAGYVEVAVPPLVASVAMSQRP